MSAHPLRQTYRDLVFAAGGIAPHCDAYVLHAPQEQCAVCNKRTDLQAWRQAMNVNFTGHYEAGKLVCFSEHDRPLETIEHWPNNRVWKAPAP